MLLREIAYQRFKEALFSNRLEPGQFVSQRELAEMLDVPLSPMREAVQRLGAAGLVRIIAQRGIQILEPTPQMVREAYELRIILELAAIKIVPLSRIAPGLAEIENKTREVISKLVEPLEFAVVKDVLDVDWQLHDLFIEAMGNQTITTVYRTNADKIRLARFRQRFTADQLRKAMDEHLQVIAALREGDESKPKGAALLELHLKTALERGLGIKSLFS